MAQSPKKSQATKRSNKEAENTIKTIEVLTLDAKVQTET